jgi:hypothetical protein
MTCAWYFVKKSGIKDVAERRDHRDQRSDRERARSERCRRPRVRYVRTPKKITRKASTIDV